MTTSEPTLGEVARKLDAIHADVKSVLRDHEDRIRRIERWMYAVPASIITAVLALVQAIQSGS